MQVNQDRVVRDIKALAECGALPGGGVTRLAFSPADMAARRYLREAMQAAGLTVEVDAFGNMRGRRAGRQDLPPVVLGSHLDSVPEGGRFDGVVGVVGALEVVRVLRENGVVTTRPIEVINFSCEESSRFGAGTLGSRVLTGHLGVDDLKRYVDKDGITLYEAVRQAGYQPDDIAAARLAPGAVHAFIELHIEQGPVLAAANCPIGIVTAIAAPTRFKVTVKGRADHSGNTPMSMRRDALAGASEIVLGVEKAARVGGDTTVGTVGYVHVRPGAMNVVPGEVELGVDIRDINWESKQRVVAAVKDLLGQVAARRGLDIRYDILVDEAPVQLSDKVITCLEQAARQAGLAYQKMPSGAGHDAMYMARITDAGMIFIPSLGGVSHNPAEESRPADICTGIELLLMAVRQLADAPPGGSAGMGGA